MRKLLIITVLALFAGTLFGQGAYMTRKIEGAVIDLRQPVFGAAAFADSAKTQSLTEDTWSVISEFVSINSNSLTVSDDTMTISKDGGYFIDAGLTFSFTSGDTMQVQLFDNATAFGPKYVLADTATLSTGVVTENVNFGTYRDLHQGDKVTLRMRNITDGSDATVMSGSLFIRRIYYEHY